MSSRRLFLSSSAAAFVGLAAAPSIGLATNAARPNSAASAAIADYVRRRMQELQIPGLSISVWRRGKTIFEAAYGEVSVELAVPASLRHVYKLASSSKLFAAPCMVGLAAQHKVPLDAKFCSLGIDFGMACPDAWRDITINQLMSHSSGIASFDELPAYQALSHEKQLSLSASEALQMAAAAPLTQVPGTSFIYGQTAYVIVGEIIRQLSQMPYVDYVKQQIFQRAGMTSMSYGDSRLVIPGRTATDYRLSDGKLITHWVDYPEIAYPAAGGNGSIGDVIKFFAGLHNETILPRELQERIWAHVVPLSDDGRVHYGLGCVIATDDHGRRFVGHEGGGQSFNRYYPGEGLAAAVLCNLNGSHGDDICKTACEIALGTFERAPEPGW